MSPRAFLGVIGAFTLIGALVGLWSPTTLEDAHVEGTAVVCGDVLGSDGGDAAEADQRNAMGRNLTGDGGYVTECRDATRKRQIWAIALAIVGGALLVGAVLVGLRNGGSTS
jgi:hypothetical protein